ncbi:MAG: hypothetical protein WAN03_04090 [Candidatus Sulfotelmatobacter sp.]
MQRMAWRILMVGLCMGTAAFGQSQSGDSLGEVARTVHAQQQSDQASGVKPKVITNQDLPTDPPPVPESSEPMTTVSGVKRSAADQHADQRANQRMWAEQRSGEQWKSRIQDQETRVADLQARIERVNRSMHAAIGTASYDTPVGRYQTIQTERLAHMQEMLDQQKQRLAQMQDAARRAGVGQ